MLNQTTTYAQVILDANSIPIGLAFPILIGETLVTGPETWRLFLRDHELLLAAAGKNGDWKGEQEQEQEQEPEYGCGCFLPEQECGGCRENDIKRWEATRELLPF